MCLHTVSEVPPTPPEGYFVCWKWIQTRISLEGVCQWHPLWFYSNIWYDCDKKLASNQVLIESGKTGGGPQYNSGFHAFPTKEAALRHGKKAKSILYPAPNDKLAKVFLYDIRAAGTEYDEEVLVGGSIFVPKLQDVKFDH